MISRSTQNKKGDLAILISLLLISAAALITWAVFDGAASKIGFSAFSVFFCLAAVVAGNIPVFYIYTLSGDDLVIVKTNGKRRKTVCSIEVFAIEKLTGREKVPGKIKRYDYRGALFARETLRVYYDDGYDRGVILLTCSESFKEGLSSLCRLYSEVNKL